MILKTFGHKMEGSCIGMKSVTELYQISKSDKKHLMQ